MQQSFFVPYLGTSDASAFDYFTAIDAIFPQVGPAGATSRESHPLVSYAQDAEQSVLFEGAMPRAYDGGIITVELYWIAAAAIAGNVLWALAWERLSQGEAVSPPSFAAAKTVLSPAPGTNGDIQKATVSFTQAEADGVTGGDPYRLLLTREGDEVGDTMDDVAQFLRLTLEGV